MALDGPVLRHEIGPERCGELVAAGHRARSVFPHRLLFLPRPGPDGYKLGRRMCGESDPARHWLVALYAHPSLLDRFPVDLFFDRDLVWHGQQHGLPGLIATADVVLADGVVSAMALHADVVQRIGRRRELKTRVEKTFDGWPGMLLNGLLAFSLRQGAASLRLPVSAFQLEHTDPARAVGPALFERIYDRTPARLYRTGRAGPWWTVDVAGNLDRLVRPGPADTSVARGPVVCVAHDVEAGLGHSHLLRLRERRLGREADRTWRAAVASMLRVEQEAGVRATYNVVGRLLPEVQREIEAGGHAIAFHSYDHDTRERRSFRKPPYPIDQLHLCREVDYRLKGYRPPRSRLTAELTTENLLRHNFEWLASGVSSLGRTEPALVDGLVRIPVHVDDFELHRSGLAYEAWLGQVLELAAAREVTVVSLHDCYSRLWLSRYPQLLERLATVGTLCTLDELAADVTLRAAV